MQAVRGGRSLDTALAVVPAGAAGAQALVSTRCAGWAAQAVRALPGPLPAAALDALLLTALALLWLAGPPYAEHTLVDQAVARLKQRGGFVNAVLRRFLRERDAHGRRWPSRPTTVARTNHPRWWAARLQRDWPAQWQADPEADQQRAPLTLRVNARVAAPRPRGAPPRLAWRQAPCPARRRWCWRMVPVTQILGFADGDVSVQDAAAQRAAPADPGWPAADRASSMPARAGRQDPRTLLELADLDVAAAGQRPEAPEAVCTTRWRGCPGRARTLAGDAGDPSAWWDGGPSTPSRSTRPCSASGIVRRHPDVRWLRRASDITALAGRLQARLLDALWPTLKRRGGRLLYCTCSFSRPRAGSRSTLFATPRRRSAAGSTPGAPGHSPLPTTMGRFLHGLIQKALT